MSARPKCALTLVVAATLLALSASTAITAALLYHHYNANLNVQDVTGELGTDRPRHLEGACWSDQHPRAGVG